MTRFVRLVGRGVVLAVLSCGGSGASPTGAGGGGVGGTATGGSGGTGSGGGVAGTGGGSVAGTGGGSVAGSGGLLPACGASGGTGGALRAQGVVLDASATLRTVPTGAAAGQVVAVTVTAIDSCATVTCTCTGPECVFVWSPGPEATRVKVVGAGDGQQWTLLLEVPGMQWDRIKVGDAFDLSYQVVAPMWPARLGHQVVLSRGGKVFLFTSNFSDAFRLPLPALTAFGIVVEDGGTVCAGTSLCAPSQHAVGVTLGTQSMAVRPGQTVTIADLTFSAARLDGRPTINAGCDSPYWLSVAGFTSP